MDRECMNVVYASNDGYARHLGTSLYSLLDRNRDFAEISVYVLTLGLSEENQGKLREIAEHFGEKADLFKIWMICWSVLDMK